MNNDIEIELSFAEMTALKLKAAQRGVSPEALATEALVDKIIDSFLADKQPLPNLMQRP